MRHAVAKLLLPPTMTLAPVGRGLVLPASLPVMSLVAQELTAFIAVALTAVVPETHLERPGAQEALDFNEIG